MKQQVSLKEADMKIKEMPMDDRPREKMLLYGARSLSKSGAGNGDRESGAR